jgi:hypothetical protein
MFCVAFWILFLVVNVGGMCVTLVVLEGVVKGKRQRNGKEGRNI